MEALKFKKLENIQDDLADEFVEQKKKENFKIEDLSGADWAFRKLKRIDSDLGEKLEYAKKELAKYEELVFTYRTYISNETAIADREKDYFKSLIERFYRERISIDPKFKLKTAQGKVNIRHSKNWDWADDVVLKFLKGNKLDEFVKVKEEVNKSLLRKECKVTDNGEVVTEDGEILEGIKVTENETFNVNY